MIPDVEPARAERAQVIEQRRPEEPRVQEKKEESPAREEMERPLPEPQVPTTLLKLATPSAIETPYGLIAKKDDLLVPVTFRGTQGRLNGMLLELRTPDGVINVSERFVDALTVGGEDGDEVLEIEVTLDNNTPTYNVKVAYLGNLFFIFPVTIPVTKRIDARTLLSLGELRPWWSPLAPPEKTPEKPKKEKHCLDDAGCKKFDINLCKGTHYCDKSADNEDDWTCTINPATVVTCNPSQEPCKVTTCNPGTGKCEKLNAQEGLKCDGDGEKCTKNDQCTHGVCAQGKWDYNDPQCQCANQQDCAQHEDGDVCNGTLFCNLWTKQCTLNPATVKYCPSVDDSACQQNTCNPLSGGCAMKPILEGKPCDDGNPCTTDDMCVVGKCKPGKNTCECQKDADCGKPADLCSGVYYCNQQVGKCVLNKAKEVHCQSVNDTACMKNSCDPKKGICSMAPVNEGQACDADGNTCTSGDICVVGSCTPGENTCECQKNADCAALEDGDVCNGTLFCHLWTHKCTLNPATIKTCSSVEDSACLKNTCNPKSGTCSMIPINEGKSCDADGYWCTEGDSCSAGACTPGKNICQCQKDADCATLEDGNACNGTLYCDKTVGKCFVNPATVQANCKT